MSFFARFKTPVYKNTGSVARDHLASERTFLAWIRTGLGLIALGSAVERFAHIEASGIFEQLKPRHDHTSNTDRTLPTDQGTVSSKSQEHLLAAALVGAGSGCIAYGIGRYFANMRMLQQGLFKPSFYGAGALGCAVTGAAAVTYWNGYKRYAVSD